MVIGVLKLLKEKMARPTKLTKETVVAEKEPLQYLKQFIK